jgi:hypothetical protein
VEPRGNERSHGPNGGQGGPFPEAKEVTLQRETIVTVLALVVVAAAIPSAITDTIETGRLSRPGSPPSPRQRGSIRTVVLLAGDVDFEPGGDVGVPRQVVVFPQPRRVALGAHEVPRLGRLRSVEDVVVADELVQVQVEPARWSRPGTYLPSSASSSPPAAKSYYDAGG